MWRMKSLIRVLLALTMAVSLAACRQSDGPLPTPAADQEGEIRDLSRDILNIASGSDPQAPKDLADDLLRYTADKRPAANPTVMELSSQTADAVKGRAISEEAALQLARHYWIAANARELSEDQIETLGTDVQTLVQSLGAPEPLASSIGAEVRELQGFATDRTRRWYEVF
jgi:predicted small lipoprotein YifL